MTIETDSIDRQTPSVIDDLGAVILCGGQSSRMRFPKHELWYDGQTFLQAVAENASNVAKAVVAVTGYGEADPKSLPPNVRLIRDARPALGPLEGIRVGLQELEDVVPYAFVTSCDAPKLRPQLIRRLAELCGDFEAVVPIKGKRIYGMTAIYRTSLHQRINDIYDSGDSRRVSALSNLVKSRTVQLEDLKDVDPDLGSFANINTVDQYFQLLKRTGLKCPQELLSHLPPD